MPDLLLDPYGVTYFNSPAVYDLGQHAALSLELVLQSQPNSVHLTAGLAISHGLQCDIANGEHLSGLYLGNVQAGDGDVFFHLARLEPKSVKNFFVHE